MSRLLLIPVAFIMMLVSPYLLWQAASQNRAGEFESANEIDPQGNESGYVLLEGVAQADQRLDCPSRGGESLGSCLYVSERQEQYTRQEREVCSDTTPTQNIIERTAEKCDEEGNCTPCYLIEEFDWETIYTNSNDVPFTIGDYQVLGLDRANQIGFSSFEERVPRNQGSLSEPISNTVGSGPVQPGDIRNNYNYLSDQTTLVVAGEARNNQITEGDKEFVISALSYGQTLKELESQDSSQALILRIISFVLMVGGWIMLLTAIASIPLMLTKLIPWIGDDIRRITNSILSFIGFTIGAIIWGIFFVIIAVAKSPILLAVAVVALGGLGYWVWKRAQDDEKAEQIQQV